MLGSALGEHNPMHCFPCRVAHYPEVAVFIPETGVMGTTGVAMAGTGAAMAGTEAMAGMVGTAVMVETEVSAAR